MMLCPVFSDMPVEIVLHIFSYLDIADLSALAHISPRLRLLAADPALHRYRLRVVAPSRLDHALFATERLRPTVRDLVLRNVFRGLDVERRWRHGQYLHSRASIVQYENSRALVRKRVIRVLSIHLIGRAAVGEGVALRSLHQSHVLPDEESSSPAVSRTLLPIVRKLKWAIQRDNLAKMVRTGTVQGNFSGTFARWLESKGRGIVEDGERVRLALCPDIRKLVGMFEELR